MIKTIGELKKEINNIDDDFTIDVSIVRKLLKKELSSDSDYPYRFEFREADLEIEVFSKEKIVSIDVEEISNECKWKRYDDSCLFVTSCSNISGIYKGYDFCPFCGKTIKMVE